MAKDDWISAQSPTLVKMRYQRTDRHADLYTVMIFDKGEHRPLLRKGRMLCCRRRRTVATLVRKAGFDPVECACFLRQPWLMDWSRSRDLLEHHSRDNCSTLLDVINLADDILHGLGLDWPDEYREVLYPLAQRLTMYRKYGAYMKKHGIDRGVALRGIEWALGAILTRSEVVDG